MCVCVFGGRRRTDGGVEIEIASDLAALPHHQLVAREPQSSEQNRKPSNEDEAGAQHKNKRWSRCYAEATRLCANARTKGGARRGRRGEERGRGAHERSRLTSRYVTSRHSHACMSQSCKVSYLLPVHGNAGEVYDVQWSRGLTTEKIRRDRQTDKRGFHMWHA